LGFLGAWLFRCETPIHEGWISLDFLGFSRRKRDLSMGYEEKARTHFLGAFVLTAVPSASSGAFGSGHAEGQDCS
jgi:hypothetical protein